MTTHTLHLLTYVDDSGIHLWSRYSKSTNWKSFPSARNTYKYLPPSLKEFHLQPIMALRGGQISALAKLISDASKVVEAHYAKSPKSYVPSLDDTEPHPIDKQLTRKELRTAIQTIEGACAQLSATAADQAIRL